ncbi:hypothetical protein AMS68_001717 [Peltaster fructicola]|uniref:Uncharacterized protein n=1 Tax=Peltaster fructicola TaxID=286661 RepID=A0A6H0XNY6_9PEZI|nr:hypothetical protein AMS68_001717 [Peltaster fructicola]
MTPLWFKGAHLSPSPSGTLLACIVFDQLRICFTSTPQRCIDFPTRVAAKDVLGLRWAPDSSRIMVLAAAQIEIIDLEDEQNRARLENGSSGFGRFSTADFLQPDQVLTVWEFGRAKIWNLSSGQSVDIDNIKTSIDGPRWSVRPATASTRAVVAYLSRPAADDLLIIQFPGDAVALPSIKLPTVDARSLHWSPDGRWLVVLDCPRQTSNVHIFTPDGHLYKTYPSHNDADDIGLGVKAVAWSPTSQALAISYHSGSIDLISGRTLSQTAVIEHSTVIAQNEDSEHTTVWQECVSASFVRSYTKLSTPVSPPVSRTKVTHEPREIGVTEAIFDCSGKYIASRDESMLSTVWIWDTQELRPQAVIIQHSNVRRMRWHPKTSSLLLIGCGENIVYLFDVKSGDGPQHIVVAANGNANFSFSGSDDESNTVLATTKVGFSLLRTAEQTPAPGHRTSGEALRDMVDQEDSLFEILSGRANIDFSHTEQLELDAAAQEGTVRLDDTFDGRKKHSIIHDPLDDSEIF